MSIQSRQPMPSGVHQRKGWIFDKRRASDRFTFCYGCMSYMNNTKDYCTVRDLRAFQAKLRCTLWVEPRNDSSREAMVQETRKKRRQERLLNINRMLKNAENQLGWNAFLRHTVLNRIAREWGVHPKKPRKSKEAAVLLFPCGIQN